MISLDYVIISLFSLYFRKSVLVTHCSNSTEMNDFAHQDRLLNLLVTHLTSHAFCFQCYWMGKRCPLAVGDWRVQVKESEIKQKAGEIKCVASKVHRRS